MGVFQKEQSGSPVGRTCGKCRTVSGALSEGKDGFILRENLG